MNWYETTKTADGAIADAGRGLITTLGVGGAVMALMIYYNISNQQATSLVTKNPQEAEVALSRIPQEQISRIQPSQQIQPPQQQSQLAPVAKPISQPAPQQSTSTLEKQLARHEGREHLAYPDGEGNVTIGIGFNLERPDARKVIESLGANFDDVYNRRQALNDAQIDALFQFSFKEARKVALGFVPDLESHPQEVQDVITNMCFIFGPNRIAKFKDLKRALDARDYNAAARAMLDSHWARSQAKNRANELSRQMQNAARR